MGNRSFTSSFGIVVALLMTGAPTPLMVVPGGSCSSDAAARPFDVGVAP